MAWSLAYLLADAAFFLLPFTPTDYLFIGHHIISALYLLGWVGWWVQGGWVGGLVGARGVGWVRGSVWGRGLRCVALRPRSACPPPNTTPPPPPPPPPALRSALVTRRGAEGAILLFVSGECTSPVFLTFTVAKELRGSHKWAARLFDAVSPLFTGGAGVGRWGWWAGGGGGGCSVSCGGCGGGGGGLVWHPINTPALPPPTHPPCLLPPTRPPAPVLFVLVRSVLTPLPVALFVGALLK